MMGLTWILHETSHAGNVGSAARAIKTMGFEHLCLVNPKSADMPKAPDAIALASGAVDVLDNTQVIRDLATACGPFSYVFGLSSRDREFGPPAISIQEACALAQKALSQDTPCAFLFGTERTGLRNEDFNYCSHRVWIDANPNYPSLNLAQAVMVCAYEMRQALKLEPTTPQQDVLPSRASIESINALMDHLSLGLEAIEFLDPKHPKKLVDRLRALFDRAELQTEEVLLLRGVAKQMLLSKDKRFKL
jgi:tRNA/rRNA methyltransferase